MAKLKLPVGTKVVITNAAVFASPKFVLGAIADIVAIENNMAGMIYKVEINGVTQACDDEDVREWQGEEMSEAALEAYDAPEMTAEESLAALIQLLAGTEAAERTQEDVSQKTHPFEVGDKVRITNTDLFAKSEDITVGKVYTITQLGANGGSSMYVDRRGNTHEVIAFIDDAGDRCLIYGDDVELADE